MAWTFWCNALTPPFRKLLLGYPGFTPELNNKTHLKFITFLFKFSAGFLYFQFKLLYAWKFQIKFH